MNQQTVEIINRVLPIIILLFLGRWIRKINFLSEGIIDGLRKVVVNLALPSVLFLSFVQIDLQTSFLVIFFVLFLLCVLLYGFGKWLGPRLEPKHPYFPFLMTGFEYGMLGISLFGSAYGLERIGYIAIIDLGHEIFIWFVFLALLLMKRDGLQRPSQLLRAFIQSPVIIGILMGILLNLIGVRESLAGWPITGAVMTTLEFLADLTIPLVLLIVGYSIKLDREALRGAFRVVLIRLAILLPLAFTLNRLLINGLLNLEKPFAAALFTLLIMPPPFIIPLFMKQDLLSERRYVNNVLMLHTVVSIVVFAIYFILNPTL